MATPQIVENADLEHLIKIIRATSGKGAKRNIALIYTLFGTGMMPSEIASLLISDYLTERNTPKADTIIRAEISFNGRTRPLMWSNKKLTIAINEYLEERRIRGLTVDRTSPLFLSRGNSGFTFKTITKNGKQYRSCASLSSLLNKLMKGAGLEGCNTGSARRTLAVKLHRKQINPRTINEILGQSSLTATKRLCQSDTNRLSDLVKDII